MKHLENYDLSALSTMQVGGRALHYFEVQTVDDLVAVVTYAKDQELPLWVAGEGSNTLFKDSGYQGVVVRIVDDRVSFERSPTATIATISSGANWDSVVATSVERGLSGIECLSHIPGSSGAAPVQNIGAYGQELSDTVVQVRALNTQTLQQEVFSKNDCEFDYRDSRFKRDKHLIITGFTLTLSHEFLLTGDSLYPSLKTYLKEHGQTKLSPNIIRQALADIRWSKLPKPSELPNCGSYFHNAVVEKETLTELLVKYPNLVHYPHGTKYKIPTGWLLENLGLKGFEHGHGFATYDKQSLVITNPNSGSFEDLMMFEHMIRKMVWDAYGLELTREPIVAEDELSDHSAMENQQ